MLYQITEQFKVCKWRIKELPKCSVVSLPAHFGG